MTSPLRGPESSEGGGFAAADSLRRTAGAAGPAPGFDKGTLARTLIGPCGQVASLPDRRQAYGSSPLVKSLHPADAAARPPPPRRRRSGAPVCPLSQSANRFGGQAMPRRLTTRTPPPVPASCDRARSALTSVSGGQMVPESDQRTPVRSASARLADVRSALVKSSMAPSRSASASPSVGEMPRRPATPCAQTLFRAQERSKARSRATARGFCRVHGPRRGRG